ncbi:hypothetical protein N8I74_12260 [Chitiniphilus purpureus]|uniref:Phage protein n=1 Tax=Chitiniphilus purpureus TaxID=2981137 RepID=A0ABY6DIC0_9NEIS|nr:hypothetical protein [Chitiniphilus sp. CD1]UXY14092.1 hypothetical protein N8I74_12260 [Chitiniphilus sp. CD1]
MKFKTTVTVMGVKGFKGEINGDSLNSTTIFVQNALDETKGTQKGFSATEHRFPDVSLYEAMKNHSYPHQAELELELVATGKGDSKTVLRAWHPIRPAQTVNTESGEIKNKV